MSVDDENLNTLIQQIYDAALDDALWPPLIDELALLINAPASLFYSPRSAENSETFALSPCQHADMDAWDDYESYFWQHDVWARDAREKGLMQHGAILHGDQIIERRTFRQTEFYCDLLKPKQAGMEVLMSAILFDESTPEQSPPMHLSFFKMAFADAFSQQDERLIRHVLPHLQRALRIRWKLACERQRCQLHEQALDQIAAAVILLDDAGRLLFANRKAEWLLRQGGNPTVIKGCLCGLDAYENNAIKRALCQARAGIGTTIRLDNAASVGTRVATFSPITAAKSEQLPAATRIIVMLTEPDKPDPGDLGAFARIYRLTAAETRVLKHLLQQQSPHEIAETLHISIKTVRTQLSALYAKTHVKNQRELIGFCLSHPMIGHGQSPALAIHL
jgi:DNA-binding CsgD family transcriptional regulator/PAS domain-containing protein